MKEFIRYSTFVLAIMGIMFTSFATFATKTSVKDIFAIVFKSLDRIESKVDRILEKK
jgi:hypothetical protein